MKVTLKCGLNEEAILLKEYPNGMLYYVKDSLIITDLNNNELDSLDIKEFVLAIKN